MKRIKQFTQILLITIFLSSCKTSINKEYPITNPEENINQNSNSEKNHAGGGDGQALENVRKKS